MKQDTVLHREIPLPAKTNISDGTLAILLMCLSTFEYWAMWVFVIEGRVTVTDSLRSDC